MSTNPPATEPVKTEAQAKLEALKQQALAKKALQDAPKVEAYKISQDCRTTVNGTIVNFKKADIVSDVALVLQLKASGIDMLPVDAEYAECPNCKCRFAAEFARK